TGNGPAAGNGPFQPGWMGWIGYGVKRETGSPDGAATLAPPAPAPTPPEALLFRPGRGATVDHVDGTTVLYWAADDPDGTAWADRTVRGLQPGPATTPAPAIPEIPPTPAAPPPLPVSA